MTLKGFSICLLALAVTMLAGCGKKGGGSGPAGDVEKPQAGGKSNAPARNEPPVLSTVDLSKGPKGEEIFKSDQGKEQASGFKTKGGKFVRHGPCVLFHDKIGGKKKWEGECYDGQWHGKLTGWYEDGTLWFERWYDKGKPLGTHRCYDGKDNIACELRFTDGKPNLTEVDCFCVVCQLAFLYGTSSWNKANPFDEDCTLFTFTKTVRGEFPDTEFLWLLGQPQERRDVLPKRYEQDWVYRCKDGTVTCRMVMGKTPLVMTQTKVSGRRKF